jgi:O-antigen ligase
MLAALSVTADYPLFGVGPGMFNYYSREYGNEGGLRALEGTREAHSLYLELAAEHGCIGLLCFLSMVSVSLVNLARMRRFWQSRDRQLEYLATGYILALATYLTTGLFLHFSYARYFWLVLALADATSHVGRSSAEEQLGEKGAGPKPPDDNPRAQHQRGPTAEIPDAMAREFHPTEEA